MSAIEIERPGNKLRIIIKTARPGIIIGRKGAEIEKHKSDVQKRFTENAMDGLTGSPADLKAMIVADRKKWADVIQSAGIRAD